MLTLIGIFLVILLALVVLTTDVNVKRLAGEASLVIGGALLALLYVNT